MKNNLKSIKERVETVLSLIPKMKVIVDVGDGEADEVDLEEVLPYELTKIFTQDRHAIGEMLLEWVESKKKKEWDEIICKECGHRKGETRNKINTEFNAHLTDLETFIKSELMNKDV